MNTYSPQGKGHMALSRLFEGEADVYDLYEAMGSATKHSHRRKCRFALEALLVDGLAWKRGDALGITFKGRAALEVLSSSEPVHVETCEAAPSVRVFGAQHNAA